MNKLLGASLLVLGMAVSPAFAGDVEFLSDNEDVDIEDSFNKTTKLDVDLSLSKNDESINDSFNKETKIDTDIKTETTNKDSFNDNSKTASLSLDASKTFVDASKTTKIDASKELKLDASKETKNEDSFNNAWGEGAANASGDDSEAHLNSHNKTEVTTKDSFNKVTKVDTTIKSESRSETTNKDSFNKETKVVTEIKDSYNKTNKTSQDVSYKDSFNKIEENKAVSDAELKNASIGNKVEVDAEKFSDAFSQASATLSGGNNWAGLNQMNVTAGNNNVSQMSQQVTANIRNLNVH